MTFTLFDTSSGNRIGSYKTRDAALDAVRREVDANDDADDLALEEFDGRAVAVIGEGRQLVRMAQAASGGARTKTKSPTQYATLRTHLGAIAKKRVAMSRATSARTSRVSFKGGKKPTK